MSRTEESIFAEALEQASPDEQAAFINAACGENAAMRARLERLVKSHKGAGSFLRRPGDATVDHYALAQPGTFIGPYKLREQIGEGGFGIVFVAEQEKPVRRKVAIKIIKPGMDTKDVVARFEAERQALALMDHPNVARVLDAGATESGRPYFVMELVHGVPITEFCDKNNLPMRERLVLFADVCRAVQHAHQKGIIHRDLKPSNIMVTLHDGKPVAKVIDFGVSKALNQQLTDKSIYTAYGQMIGTPSYMSPEQAEMSGLGIDTRSDIYSLGVLLYELLTGTTPLDAARLRSGAHAEILRMIKEEEPPRPSMKVSTLGEEATVIAQHRDTDPQKLRRDLAGELDWIVMRCLEKDRARRYETANGLARDIERYLSDEPVEACPPSTWYRVTKFTRKHRVLISTVAAFAGLLFIFATTTGWLAVRATLAERRALAEQAQSELARQEAVAAKEKAVWASQRLRAATQLANEGTEFYYRKNWASALAKFDEAREIEPDLNSIYIYRGMLYTEIGLWDLAAADYAQTFRLSTRNHWQSCYEHALLQYYIGNEPGYRTACKEFVRQYGRSNSIDVQMRLLTACCFSPRPAMDPAELTRRADNLYAASDKPWHRAATVLAYLRAGNHQKAFEVCDQLLASATKSAGGIHRTSYVPQAIALQALGRSDEARDSLVKFEVAREQWVKEMVDGPFGTMPIDWFDWLQFTLLYREAKANIGGEWAGDDQRLATLRKRALAITQGDDFTIMEAGRKAIENQAWDDAADSFVTAIDKLPLAVLPSPQQFSFYLDMVQQPEVFERVSQRRPDQYALWMARGQMFANRREWSQAADDHATSLAMLEKNGHEGSGPAMFVTYSLAALRLLAGDEAGYSRLCNSVVRSADRIDDPHLAHAISRTCSLSDVAGIDRAIALRLAQQSVSAHPETAWYLYGLGAAHYRAGQYEQAIDRLEESLLAQPLWLGRSQNYVILAMACQRLRRHEEARDWLAKSKTSFEELEQAVGSERYGFAGSPYLSDWLAIQVLLPEAEKLLAVDVSQ